MTLEKDATIDATDLEIDAVSPLRVFVGSGAGSTRVVLAGELDDATVGFLFGRLREATGELAADLTIDMGLLTFIDSTGLSLPVTLDKHVRALRWTLTLTDPTPMRAACFRSRHWIRC